MTDIRHTHRLFTTAALAPKAIAPLSEDQTHHLVHVLRLATGDVLRLFNERDGEYVAVVTATGKKTIEVTAQEQIRAAASEADLWLCPAPIKKTHFDYMIEKATELGVSEIQPILTHRTQIREVNADRLYKICREAAEQSDRLSVPAIGLPVSIADLVSVFPADRAAIICAEYGEAAPVHAALSSLALQKFTKAAIITGPEGGFAEEEFDALRQIPNAHFVRLGPRILRADTAAIAAITCWQAVRGDWR